MSVFPGFSRTGYNLFSKFSRCRKKHSDQLHNRTLQNHRFLSNVRKQRHDRHKERIVLLCPFGKQKKYILYDGTYDATDLFSVLNDTEINTEKLKSWLPFTPLEMSNASNLLITGDEYFMAYHTLLQNLLLHRRGENRKNYDRRRDGKLPYTF